MAMDQYLEKMIPFFLSKGMNVQQNPSVFLMWTEGVLAVGFDPLPYGWYIYIYIYIYVDNSS